MTLILLSVTLVMAIAFLAVSRRERGSVTTESDTTTAKLAADAALAHAEAQINAALEITTNPYYESLMVSTNYYNSLGFNPGAVNPTNVNYNYLVNNGGPLTTGDQQAQNIANLYFSPRPPVYYSNDFRFYLDLNRNGEYDTNGVVTNVDNNLVGLGSTSVQVGDPEWIGVLEHPDQPHGPNNPFIARYCFIAVPADSLDINTIHNQALDVGLNNGNGNTSVNPNLSGNDAYSRNQGIGAWEINLAAFLTDLNPNRWDTAAEPYAYPGVRNGSSVAFDDARALVAWRYANSYLSLQNADTVFGNVGAGIYVNNGVDAYSIWQQTNFDVNYAGLFNPSLPWLGAPNPDSFFYSPSELFDPTKSSTQFATNLFVVGTSNATFDRYTFYRMLGQIGTDSSAESGKINLNYQNAIVVYNATGIPKSITIVPNMETNFIPWAPRDFFTAAADKMLRAYSAQWFEENPTNYLETYYATVPRVPLTLSGMGMTNIPYFGLTNQIPSFSITNIPVFVNGIFVYSPAVNRLLQIAANIYDASTTNFYPDVFRPIFEHDNFNNVYIVGYTNLYSAINGANTVSGINDPQLSLPYDLTNWVNLVPANAPICINVYGVPWIIGAKKGLPNFNRMDLLNGIAVQRLLKYERDPDTFKVYDTNQMYEMMFSNVVGLACWNPYVSNYNHGVTISVNYTFSSLLTNDTGMTPIPNTYFTNRVVSTVQPWQGLLNIQPFGGYITNFAPLSLARAAATNTTFVYYFGSGPNSLGFPANSFIPQSLDPENFLDVGLPNLPQFGLSMTNSLQIFMLDNAGSEHVVDYVHFAEAFTTNLTDAISEPPYWGWFSTNMWNGIPFGLYAEWLTNMNAAIPSSFPVTSQQQKQNFDDFFSGQPIPGSANQTNIQTWYPALGECVVSSSWQADDPIVHSLASDLFDAQDYQILTSTNYGQVPRIMQNVITPTAINDRYLPWGNPTIAGQQRILPGSYNGFHTDQNPYNPDYKDPLVVSADNWDFPTNLYPTVGWLGRVHRGTPWQTVYLKATNILALVANAPAPPGQLPNLASGWATWQLWTGNQNSYDAVNSAPMQDRLLFDLFTATPDDNATRGKLSVNVGADDVNNPLTGLAAWSALLSGSLAFSNSVNDTVIKSGFRTYAQDPVEAEVSPGYSNIVIQPLGAPPFPNNNIANSAMFQIVQGINRARTNYIGPDGLHGAFEHVGDVLSAPQLTEQSPYLHWQNNGLVDAPQQQNGISDEMYEWLPQQTLGLMTVTGTPQSPPRYVVYCYGQTLKPAPNGIVTSGTYFGLVTNYQVVAESGARAVIRVENAPTPANPNATPHVIVEQYNPLPPD